MKSLFALGAMALASTAFCQVAATGPFAGALTEGFESFDTWGNVGSYDSMSVMGGAATLTSNPVASNQLWVFDGGSSYWGLGGYGLTSPHSGDRALGLQYVDGNVNPVNVSLEFSTAVTSFGGYMGTVDSDPTTIRFFDAGGVQIGADQQLLGTQTALQWVGWSSSTAIKRIDFIGGIAPAMDDLQADPVPEPVSLVVLGLGSLVALRRRRRA